MLHRSPRPLGLSLLAAVFLLVAAITPSVALTTRPTAPALLDINTAAPDQLKALPGMGVVYVRRIIDGRPYAAKNQLLNRGVIPLGAYNKIKDQIIASHPRK